MQLLQISAGDLQRFLETPGELLEESEEFQVAIALFSETPRNLLEVLMESDYSAVVEVARLHVNWVGEVREDYRGVVSEVLRDKDLGENDRLAVELMRFAPVPPEFLSEWVGVNWLIQGLKNEYMPLRYRLKLLERLSNQGELEARLQVAESRETPVSILELLVGDLDLAVRLATEYNDNCPSEVIELVKTQHDLASNWDGDLEQLEELGESDWGWVRLAVAQNPYASEDVLMKLAGDEEFRIRLAVAKNPGTSAEVLNVLMESGDSGIRGAISLGIRFAIAEHPNATEEILHQLFSAHRDVIHKRNDLPTSIIERFFRETFTEDTLPWRYKYNYLIFFQLNIPAWILAKLANIDLEILEEKESQNLVRSLYSYDSEQEMYEESLWNSIGILKYIVKHPQVSKEILEKLAKYQNPYIKLAVAQSQRTSEELKLLLLEELSVYPNRKIKIKIAEDSNTPAHILEVLGANQSYRDYLLLEIKRALASDCDVDNSWLGPIPNKLIFDFKNEYLYPSGIDIDVERYMEVIQTPEILEQIISWDSFEYDEDDDEEENIDTSWFLPKWQELFADIPQNLAQAIVFQFIQILKSIVGDVTAVYAVDSIALALVGNPNTPVSLRESLKNQLFPHDNNGDVLLALAYNPEIPETERMEYFQKIILEKTHYIGAIAKDTRTPVYLLEQLLGYCQGNIAKNPATPEYLLRRIADERDENLWRTLADNPNTPSDLLFRFLHEKVEKKIDSNLSMFDLVIKNPGLSILERYQLLLEKENNQITAQVHEFMARRSHSPYALAQSGNSEDDTLESNFKQTSFTLSSLPRIYNPNNDDLATVLTEYASSDNAFVRFVTLLHPLTPGEILTQAANSAFWLERYAISLRHVLRDRGKSRDTLRNA
ncbi:MAG: hypothetical protein AAF915_30800 [Cyanobacteria bacterium P01_D01_bin.50]